MTSPFWKRIWPWLVRLRLDHVPTLAKHLGVAPSTLNRGFRETAFPRPKILLGLHALGVPLDVLVGGPNDRRLKRPRPVEDQEELELVRFIRHLRPEAREALMDLATGVRRPARRKTG